MISVVLCCYNGEKYIKEQLASIHKQSKQVDEVIIYDDGSSDNTVIICKEFIDSNNLNNWRIIQNQVNRGVYLNFMKGCTDAKGDIIFLADQDDIWHYDKVEIMSKYFASNNKILSLATGFKNIDKNGDVISKKVKHPYRKKNDLREIKFIEFLKFYNYLGMTMAIRKSLINDISIYGIEKGNQRKEIHLTHDIALNFYAVLCNGLFFLDKQLVTRRTHLESTSNINNPNYKSEILENNEALDPVLLNIKMYITVIEWFLILLDSTSEKERNIILKYRDFYRNRYNILLKKDMKELIKTIKYITCYKTPLHYINDYMYILKNRKINRYLSY